MAHICKHNKHFSKDNTVLSKQNKLLAKHNIALSKHNTTLSKHNTELSKHITILSKHNTVSSKHNTILWKLRHFVAPLSVSLVLVSFATFSPQKWQNFEEDFKPAPQLAQNILSKQNGEQKWREIAKHVSGCSGGSTGGAGPYLKVWPRHWVE